MARIFITARFQEEVLRRLMMEHSVRYESWQDTGGFLSGDVLVQTLNSGDFDIYVTEGEQISAPVIAHLRTTRLICVARSTPDNVDIAAATQAGILVTHTPGRNAIAVAEFTIGLILDVVRHITRSYNLVMTDSWEWCRLAEVEGFELSGRTAGLVGVGHIGKEVAQRLHAFGMHVLGYDPYVAPEVATAAGVVLVPLNQLMREADIVSIHAAATPETRGLIGAQEIALMKPTAVLINTARAAIVDEVALYEALRERRIAAAALDVFEREPVTRYNTPLASLPNVLVTPHLGGATRDVVRKHSAMIEEDIKAYVNRRCPARAINPQVWNRQANES